jgi:hypothetical protein
LAYNPFTKRIGELLNPNDLQELISRNVAEGYYVEYKETFPLNDKIGRSIASLANTYGGWYIVGVKTDTHNVANDVCGFDIVTCPDSISKVREVIKSHIDPTPDFFPQVVSLTVDKAVLVVYIPSDQETPFITKDGRIYRRVSDSSDPVPETNRYTVDRLVDKGRETLQRFESFCRDERTFSQAEDKQAWINVYLATHPPDVVDKYDLLSRANLENLMEKSKVQTDIHFGKRGNAPESESPLKLHVVFNSGQLTHKSLILRHVEPDKIAFNSPTVELFVNGWAKFLIPLPQSNYLTAESEEARRALSNIPKQQLSLLKFFDVGRIWLVLAYLFTFYLEWLGDQPLVTELKTAVIMDNVWRSVPLIDSDDFGEYVQKFGLPIIQADSIRMPEWVKQGFYLPLNDNVPAWLNLCIWINLAFGLPMELSSSAVSKAAARLVPNDLRA